MFAKVKHLTTNIDPLTVTLKKIEKNIIRCPDPLVAQQMIDLILQTKKRAIVSGEFSNV